MNVFHMIGREQAIFEEDMAACEGVLRDLPSHPVFNPGQLVRERDEGGAGPQ